MANKHRTRPVYATYEVERINFMVTVIAGELELFFESSFPFISLSLLIWLSCKLQVEERGYTAIC